MDLLSGADDTLYAKDLLERVAAELIEPRDVVYGNVVSERFSGRYDGPFDQVKPLRRNICHQALFFRRRMFANFAHGGLSAAGDLVWREDRRFNYLRYAHPVLPTARALGLLLREMGTSVKRGGTRRILSCLGIGARVATRSLRRG